MNTNDASRSKDNGAETKKPAGIPADAEWMADLTEAQREERLDGLMLEEALEDPACWHWRQDPAHNEGESILMWPGTGSRWEADSCWVGTSGDPVFAIWQKGRIGLIGDEEEPYTWINPDGSLAVRYRVETADFERSFSETEGWHGEASGERGEDFDTLEDALVEVERVVEFVRDRDTDLFPTGRNGLPYEECETLVEADLTYQLGWSLHEVWVDELGRDVKEAMLDSGLTEKVYMREAE